MPTYNIDELIAYLRTTLNAVEMVKETWTNPTDGKAQHIIDQAVTTLIPRLFSIDERELVLGWLLGNYSPDKRDELKHIIYKIVGV